MPKFSSIFLSFLGNQTQKHKHKLIFSKNRNTNTNLATDFPCQSNTKATDTNPVRSKQLKTISSKCSSRALPLVFPISNRWNKLFFYFIIHTSLWLSLSHSLAIALPLSRSLLSLSLSLTAWTSMDKLKLCYTFLKPPFTISGVHRCASLVLSLSPLFFFFSPWGIQGQNHSLSPSLLRNYILKHY